MIRGLFGFLAKQALKIELDSRKDMLGLLERDPNAKLLDLGCGDGGFTLEVARWIGTRRIYGVDIVPENISKAREQGIEARVGDLNGRFPFEDEGFDVIMASHVFEHLWNTDSFIKEIRRTLKRGGYLVIATPNLASFHNILFLIMGKQPTIVEISDEALVGTWSPRGRAVGRIGPAHRRVPTLSALKGLLEYYGFEVERTIATGFLPLPDPLAKIVSRLDKRHATNVAVKARKA